MATNRPTTFIGPGAMAEAMAAGMIRKAGVAPEDILMSGPELDQNQKLEEKYGFRTIWDNAAAVENAEVIVISVKPQTIGRALADLHSLIPEDALVLSIVAGSQLADIAQRLNHQAIVRAMPNTPAQVGEGITVWTPTEQVNEKQKELTRKILQAIGKEVLVDDEDYLDMATALSGTGPAYVYMFMEAMVDAGVHLGFPRRIAEELVVQTVKGSVAFYEHSPAHLARLRNQVTSPGGTSAAALYYLEKAGFRTAISRAIWGAYERSRQLGRGKKRGPVED
jgi:pyrroline-5-carboxylate reductase